MDNNNFPIWLKEQMRAKGWRQSEFAKVAHVDPAVVSNIITGKRGIGIDICNAFAKALQIPPEIVMQAAGLLSIRDKSKDVYIIEINSIYDKFNVRNKRQALETFRMLLRLQEQGEIGAKEDNISPE